MGQIDLLKKKTCIQLNRVQKNKTKQKTLKKQHNQKAEKTKQGSKSERTMNASFYHGIK